MRQEEGGEPIKGSSEPEISRLWMFGGIVLTVIIVALAIIIPRLNKAEHNKPAKMEKSEASNVVVPPSTPTPERAVVPIAPKENRVETSMSKDQVRRLRAAGQDLNGPISSITPPTVKK